MIEDRRSGDQEIASRVPRGRGRLRVNTPVHFDEVVQPPRRPYLRKAEDPCRRAGEIVLAPKPGLTLITRTRPTRSSTSSSITSGVAGLSVTPGTAPASRIIVSRRFRRRRLTVDGDDIRTGRDERFDVPFRLDDHQVRLDRQRGCPGGWMPAPVRRWRYSARTARP